MESGIDLLSIVFGSASEGIIISDIKGVIISANPMAENMFGYKAAELEGINIDNLVPNPHRGKHHAHREGYFKNPKPRPMGIGMDLNGLRHDGSIFPIEISLNHFEHNGNKFVASFVNDISERKKNEEKLKNHASHLQEKVKERTQELEHLNLGLRREVMERRAAELALRKSQNLYELVAKNFPNGTVNIVDQDFKILFLEGKGIVDQTRKNELKGQNFITKLPKDEQENASNNLEKSKNGETSSWHYETETEAFMIHAAPIGLGVDSTEQILIVEENITEIKKAEREMRKLLSRERELNEMKSRFVSMASHEFRTPLSTILSSTNLLEKYTQEDQQDKRDKHLNRIKSAVKNLTEILNDFLSLEKLEEGSVERTFQKIKTQEFILEILGDLGGIKKTKQLFTFNPKNLSTFITDGNVLRNIFLNLISNAIKYSPDEAEIIINLSQTKALLKIEIIDHGMGIPKDEQEHLFERFFRAKNAFNIQGTGLGLHIVKKYVDLLEGEIQFKSEVEKGTTVTVSIPNGKEKNSSH